MTTTNDRRQITVRSAGAGRSARTFTILAVSLCALTVGWMSSRAAVRPGRPAESEGRIIHFEPSMTTDALLAHSDADRLEFSDGRRMSIGSLRRVVKALQRRPRRDSGSPPVAVLRNQPTGTGTPMATVTDLAAAAKHQDGETLVLPSGRRLTVGQLRFLRPVLETHLGRGLNELPYRPALGGPATPIKNGVDFKEILQRPDSDVVASPNGVRLTVGELKQALSQSTMTSQGGAVTNSAAGGE